MSDKITYLITGANRGLGFGLTQALLLRPNTTVLASVRNATNAKYNHDLVLLKCAPGSEVKLGNYSPDADSKETAAEVVRIILEKKLVERIDVVIANAGMGEDFVSCTDTTPEALTKHFQVNTIGPIELFQAVKPLLSPSAKFILISSILGSITSIDAGSPCLAYGISKVAANYFIKKLHGEEKDVVTLAIHPGWVKTGNGQAFADAMGVEAPPMSVEESVEGVLAQIDAATKETTSGSFVDWKGEAVPW